MVDTLIGSGTCLADQYGCSGKTQYKRNYGVGFHVEIDYFSSGIKMLISNTIYHSC